MEHDTGITQWLRQWQQGDESALEVLLPLVYEDLRRIAVHELRSNRGHETLQPTALINDVFVRLLGANRLDIGNRKHLFTTAAKLMRQILVEHARAKGRLKRAGNQQRITLTDAIPATSDAPVDVEALDAALTRLANMDPELARLVELRFFGGLSIEETAHVLGVSPATVKRSWATARAWIKREMQGDQ